MSLTNPKVVPASIPLPPEHDDDYKGETTLGEAAEHIWKVMDAALNFCNQLLEVFRTSPGRPFDPKSIAEDKKALHRMSCDFVDIETFLQESHEDFDFTYLPDNFFKDMGAISPEVVTGLEALSRHEGYGWLRVATVAPLQRIGVRLGSIKAERLAIWQKSKAEFELDRAAERRSA